MTDSEAVAVPCAGSMAGAGTMPPAVNMINIKDTINKNIYMLDIQGIPFLDIHIKDILF